MPERTQFILKWKLPSTLFHMFLIESRIVARFNRSLLIVNTYMQNVPAIGFSFFGFLPNLINVFVQEIKSLLII